MRADRRSAIYHAVTKWRPVVISMKNKCDVTITWERTIEGVRAATIDPDLIEGFEYGFRDAGDEFGGGAVCIVPP